MSQGLGGGSNSSSDHHSFGSEPLHVAQQSRRDKLRHQFVSEISIQNPNANTNHEFLDNCTNMLINSSGIVDLAHGASSFINRSSAGDNWINNASIHPFFQSNVFHLENQHLSLSSTYENTLQAMINASPSSSSLVFEGGLIDHPHQKVARGETQGLALSLVSNPRIDAASFNSCPDVPPKILVDPRRSVGPLGPFTGYATILKSSKFLKPAQQLLDESCSTVTGLNGSARSGNSVGELTLSTSFHGTSEGEGSGANCLVDQPLEIQQKKVKLLYMQEEVCRRYNQYRQQMKMVVSSFKSVADLGAATPYASLALEAISKQFKCIKLAISNQLRHVSRVLGEDFMPSPSSSSRGETIATPQQKHLDQSLRKQKASENTSIGFLDNNQPVWRPQRGLPERAVSVLRSWLFEHFLHPYPTDTDKNMLATQTGLTRNQVSNWFINARVRLWKPMVEEIHMLESNGVSEMDLNSSNKNDGKSNVDDQGFKAIQSDKTPLDCSSSMDHPVVNHYSNSITMQQWHPEKRTMGEIDGGLLSFGHAGGLDIEGLGAVSLTLGLRQNEDPQYRHFGSPSLQALWKSDA